MEPRSDVLRAVLASAAALQEPDKGLDPRWHAWSDVVAACESLALRLSGAA